MVQTKTGRSDGIELRVGAFVGLIRQNCHCADIYGLSRGDSVAHVQNGGQRATRTVIRFAAVS